MVALKVGSAEHAAVFGQSLDALLKFESELPTHQQIQNAWLDPSLRGALGVDQFSRIAAKQAKDMRQGVRVLLTDLASDFGNEVAEVVNFPTDLLSGLRATIQSSPIASSLSEADVLEVFNGEDAGAKL